MPLDDISVIERLTRIEEKQDSILDHMTLARSTADDHETRIRVLEKSGARMLGMGAVVAALSGILGPGLFQKMIGG
jgi:hypothetical protein